MIGCPILVFTVLQLKYIRHLTLQDRCTTPHSISSTFVLLSLDSSGAVVHSFSFFTMKLFGADVLYPTLLLVSSVNAFSFDDLSKRALKFDPSCNTKYGSLTGKQLIDKSIDFQPKLAKAGKDGLDTLIAALKFQSGVAGAEKPTVSQKELETIFATYRVLFGNIQPKNADGSDNPNFKKEAADHIDAIEKTRDSLTRMTKPGNPDLIIHCNDDWLSERGPKTAGPKPAEPLKAGAQYLYDMDRNRWVSVKGGKPCQGNKGAVTSMNKKLTGTTREKGPERYEHATCRTK